MQLRFEQSNFQDPQCININITEDRVAEGTETFVVRLMSSGQGVVLNLTSAVVTILDDDSKCA